jgi:hypothetical protein
MHSKNMLKLIIKKLIVFIFVFVLAFSFLPIKETAAAVYETDVTPWSGYWWPYRFGGLGTGLDYRGYPSPIEKYLLLTTGDDDGPLLDWYMNRHYDPNALAWEGLCPYFARAAANESYDIFPSSEDNMVVRVGDKKGLLMLCHDFDTFTKANGDNPVRFHFWLLDYIKDQGRAFTADLSQQEVWWYPVYKYDMTTQRIGLQENVSVRIYYASDNVSPDYVGTHTKTKSYTYTLTLNSAGDIIDGEWTGSSITNHPDTMEIQHSAAAKCPYIDCDYVRQLAQSKDDFLEIHNNGIRPIDPGTYNLILLDPDQYIINGQPGDSVYIKIEKDDTSDEAIEIEITDAEEVSIFNDTLVSKQKVESVIQIENPPYLLSLTQENYTEDPNIYILSVDKRTAFYQNVPFIPKDGSWSGFVVANTSDETTEDVMLVTSDKDGQALQTVFGPTDLEPGEKQILMLEDLPWRPLEYSDLDSIMMMANQQADFLNLFALDFDPMAGFVQGNARGTHLVVPDTSGQYNFSRRVQGAVFNETFDQASVSFSVFKGDGELKTETTETIDPGGIYSIIPGRKPFYHTSDDGWIEIASEGAMLSAYQYMSNQTGNWDVIDTIFALPVENTDKVVPIVTQPDGWWTTKITLINPNDQMNTVKLHFAEAGLNQDEDMNLEFDAYEKRVINITDLLGKMPGEAYYQSILEVSSQDPIVGYYSYASPYGGDQANFPLLDWDAFKDELSLYHLANNSVFWTGVCICNPNDFQVKVKMEVYDHEGEMIGELGSDFELKAGTWEVFTVASMFGDKASDISFIKFISEDPSGAVIGGFYMYGSHSMKMDSVAGFEMLSGANM